MSYVKEAPYAVRAVRAEEWARVRELRLAALCDPAAPIAFLETFEEALVKPESVWREWASGVTRGGDLARQFIAEAADGSWAGSCTALIEEAGGENFFGLPIEVRQAHLVGVFVRPGHRGNGLIERLFATALDWAWSLDGVERARLFVHEANGRAEAAYRKAGFARTGLRVPTREDPGAYEIEMELKRGA